MAKISRAKLKSTEEKDGEKVTQYRRNDSDVSGPGTSPSPSLSPSFKEYDEVNRKARDGKECLQDGVFGSRETSEAATGRRKVMTRRPLGQARVNSLLLPIRSDSKYNSRRNNVSDDVGDSIPDDTRHVVESTSKREEDKGLSDKSKTTSSVAASRPQVRETPRRTARKVQSYALPRSLPAVEGNSSSEEKDSDGEFDSLDDFIVGDDESISYVDDGSDSESVAEESNNTRPAPSPRKLFRGLRPKKEQHKSNNTTKPQNGLRFPPSTTGTLHCKPALEPKLKPSILFATEQLSPKKQQHIQSALDDSDEEIKG